LLQNTVHKSTTTNIGSLIFWNVMSHHLVPDVAVPSSRVLMYKKNKVTHQPMKIKPLCHLQNLVTNYPGIWNYFSQQIPQQQQC